MLITSLLFEIEVSLGGIYLRLGREAGQQTNDWWIPILARW